MDFNELSKLVEEATVRLRALMGRGADPYGQLSGFLKGSWDKQKVLIRKLQDDDRVEWDSRTGIWLFKDENEEDTVYRFFTTTSLQNFIMSIWFTAEKSS